MPDRHQLEPFVLTVVILALASVANISIFMMQYDCCLLPAACVVM
jgi:hypothetical protein